MSEIRYPKVVFQIVTMGNIPPHFAVAASVIIQFELGVEAKIAEAIGLPNPDGCFLPDKRAYENRAIHRYLTGLKPEGARLLVITDAAIYSQEANSYVHGSSDFCLPRKGSVTIVSVLLAAMGLGEARENVDKFYNCVFATILHEMGHAGNLAHCDDAGCVMQSGAKKYPAELPPAYCQTCSVRLHSYLDILNRYADYERLTDKEKVKWYQEYIQFARVKR
ncbi:MAG: hypothetical protein AAB731_01290 [Patescibacteria group bacterium]